MKTIFWHRQDLRTSDNLALIEACRKGKIVPVYVRDPEIHGELGVNQKAFVEEGLVKLSQHYDSAPFGSGLVVSDGDTVARLQKLVERFEAERLVYGEAVDPRRREISRKVEQELDVKKESVMDRMLVNPEQLEESYSSFSQFYSDWKQKPKISPAREPEEDELETLESEIPEPSEPEAELPEPGYEAADRRLSEFLDGGIQSYRDERDNLSDEGVSRMSPYISNGMIGMREVLKRAMNRMEEEDSKAKKNIAKYRSELAWREWFQFLMLRNPETIEKNYREMKPVKWEDDPEKFRAWKEGRTGVPLVDAGMRQLRAEGYMHNRTRQNVASFLTKHLLVDWRKGARFFEEKLVDHDTASNYGSWQWSASTGTDTVPVRIFSPVKQGREYDPDAEYIRRHVSELRELKAEEIHGWVEKTEEERESIREQHDMDYPEPIIDYDRRFQKAKKVFEEALNR